MGKTIPQKTDGKASSHMRKGYGSAEWVSKSSFPFPKKPPRIGSEEADIVMSSDKIKCIERLYGTDIVFYKFAGKLYMQTRNQEIDEQSKEFGDVYSSIVENNLDDLDEQLVYYAQVVLCPPYIKEIVEIIDSRLIVYDIRHDCESVHWSFLEEHCEKIGLESAMSFHLNENFHGVKRILKDVTDIFYNRSGLLDTEIYALDIIDLNTMARCRIMNTATIEHKSSFVPRDRGNTEKTVKELVKSIAVSRAVTEKARDVFIASSSKGEFYRKMNDLSKRTNNSFGWAMREEIFREIADSVVREMYREKRYV